MPTQWSAWRGTEGGRDRRTPVTTLRAERVVAEGDHQLDPCRGDPLDAPAGPRRLVAEPVAGHRRADDVERVGRVAAVAGGVAQRLDDVEELDDRSGPAVREHEREGAGVRRRRVQDLDAQAVGGADVGREPELLEAVQLGLDAAPVVAAGPVRAQLLDVGERDALRPVVDGLPFRPARAGEALLQVVEVRLGDGDRDVV